MKIIFIYLLLSTICIFADDLYFPPLNSDEWETISPVELGWNTQYEDELFDYLDENNSKSFMVLKDGKIVYEKYFKGHHKDSIWYWASASKTITTLLIGIAQEQGLLDIEDNTSKYLGNWTNCDSSKENAITIKHQLSMTSGFEITKDLDLDCILPECFKCKYEPGSYWYYHNAPYQLLKEVISETSGMDINIFTFNNLSKKIGMKGFWIHNENLKTYLSDTRSMARFGIMMLANGNWKDDEIIEDKNYYYDLINTSQDLNKSYGYMWWLNGKESYMIPQLDMVIQGELNPYAPDDMYSAMGKNGQILNLVPSQNLIMIRMGDPPDDDIGPIAFNLNRGIWERFNKIYNVTSVYDSKSNSLNFYPNPVNSIINFNKQFSKIEIFSLEGNKLMKFENVNQVKVDNLSTGVYSIFLYQNNDVKRELFIKQ